MPSPETSSLQIFFRRRSSFGDRSFGSALAVSLLVHGVLLGAAIHHFARSSLPNVQLQPSAGGDGVESGASFAFLSDTPEPGVPTEERLPPPAPSPSPAHEATPVSREVESAFDSARFVAAGSRDGDAVARPLGPARSRIAAPAVHPSLQRMAINPADDSDGVQPGEQGLAGDGFATAVPVPGARNRPPRYPPDARASNQQGTVTLDVDVRPSGSVSAAEVITSSGYALLDDAALEAVRQWQFTPATQSGRVVACHVRVPIRFVLKR